MAIIKCPECNGNISTTSERCVHCGAKYTYCPECSNVFLGDPAVCNECGFVLKNDEKENDASTKMTVNELISDWRSASIFRKKSMKLILFFFEAVLFFIAGNYIFKEIESARESGVLMLIACKELAVIIILFAVWIIVSGAIENYLINHNNNTLLNYSRSKNINLQSLVVTELSQDFDKIPYDAITKSSKNWEFAVSAAFYGDIKNFSEKNLYKTKNILKTLLNSAALICLTVFTIINSKIYLLSLLIDTAEQTDSVWNTSMIINWEWLIISVVLLAISAVFHATTEKKITAKKTEWLRETSPQAANNYAKHIKSISGSIERAQKIEHQ